MAAASLVAIAAGLFATSAPAGAAARDIGSGGVNSRCDSSPYLLCLFYSGNYSGAYWGTSSYVANLSNSRFISGTGSGAGQVVRNNAASMSCDTSVAGNLWCWSYYNTNRGGNVDYLLPQRSGNLYYTWNDEASVDIF
ncbi:hypothetical protein ACTI_79640 [Actinoplanes sp. OR16]|uniref:hypothetical protein n=1 Tax=Actinoplanes sp. OR16 TaxID=946334 RepID=UPI000F6E9703|nr:hypothetical protein [Actinoplanes sp. OR16]BBH71279.1 hypothetical protein ACTI_79640 [Actinoplanes sp. OR16]